MTPYVLFDYIKYSYLETFSFITGSYDRTCKIWDTATGKEVRSLDGHTNVVYTIAFNWPVSGLFIIVQPFC